MFYTLCIDGKTLVQSTNPNVGNKRSYFTRTMTQYEKGFGYTSREIFVGLKSLYYLNRLGNVEIFLNANSWDTLFK